MFVESVAADKFWPMPKVNSAIVSINVKKWPDPEISKQMWRLARAGFATRRKQLHNSLAAVLRIDSMAVKKKLAGLGLSENARPQELSVENWLNLASIIS
jgi:16S rRNA (adenine1518-N6/adenine1519-N6)-dimethyltransferase